MIFSENRFPPSDQVRGQAPGSCSRLRLLGPNSATTAMDPEPHQARAFFGRRKGHKLRKRQAELIDTLLPRLAIDVAGPAPAELTALFPLAVNEIALEIGFG